MLFMLFGLPLMLGIIGGFLIAKKVHDSLMHSGNKNYVGLSFAAFLVSFLVIGFVLYLIVYSFMDYRG